MDNKTTPTTTGTSADHHTASPTDYTHEKAITETLQSYSGAECKVMIPWLFRKSSSLLYIFSRFTLLLCKLGSDSKPYFSWEKVLSLWPGDPRTIPGYNERILAIKRGWVAEWKKLDGLKSVGVPVAVEDVSYSPAEARTTNGSAEATSKRQTED